MLAYQRLPVSGLELSTLCTYAKICQVLAKLDFASPCFGWLVEHSSLFYTYVAQALLSRRKHDIEAQVERARKVARIESAEDDAPQASELKRDETDQPLKISLAALHPDKTSSKAPPVPKFDGTFAEDSRYASMCGSELTFVLQPTRQVMQSSQVSFLKVVCAVCCVLPCCLVMLSQIHPFSVDTQQGWQGESTVG